MPRIDRRLLTGFDPKIATADPSASGFPALLSDGLPGQQVNYGIGRHGFVAGPLKPDRQLWRNFQHRLAHLTVVSPKLGQLLSNGFDEQHCRRASNGSGKGRFWQPWPLARARRNDLSWSPADFERASAIPATRLEPDGRLPASLERPDWESGRALSGNEKLAAERQQRVDRGSGG